MIVTSNNLFKTKSGLGECRWIALNNPNYITIVRQDYQVSLIITSGTNNVLVNTTGIAQAQFESDFTVGSQVYLSAINKTVTITARTYIGFNSTFSFALDGITYSTGGGYANCFSRTDYFVELKYIRLIDTGQYPTYEEKIIPFNNGEAKVNISQSLLTFFTLKTDNEDLSVLNIRDANVSGLLTVNYKEYYQGSYKSETQLIPTFYGVNNQKKAFEEFGSCLAEYEMQLLSNNKFLTRMEKPYYWAGYPFSLGFIFPLSIADANPHKLEIEQDINENTIATNDEQLSLFNPAQNYEYVNSLTLEGGYTGHSVLVRLVTPTSPGGTVFDYATEYADNYFRNFVFPPILLPQIISELKRVYIGQCTDSPCYLRWRNSLGSFDYWMFTKRQVKTNEVGRFETFNPLIEDIEFQQESESVQSKEFNKRWRVGAYLEMQSITDIQELFTSPFVQWFNEENQKWYTVKLLAGSYVEDVTDEVMQEIEFSIEFPQEYNQEQ